MTRTELIHLTEETVWKKPLLSFPLYKCNAKVYEIVRNKCYALRSYNTMVSIVDCTYEGRELYVFDYYSHTTNATHISRFKKWIDSQFGYGKTFTVHLYQDSKMSKARYQRLSFEDWILCISDRLQEYLNSVK